MSDITIKSNGNQEDNQKTTPATGSLSGRKEAISSLPNAIINSWLELRYGNITFSDELDFDPRELQSIWSDENSGSIS